MNLDIDEAARVVDDFEETAQRDRSIQEDIKVVKAYLFDKVTALKAKLDKEKAEPHR